MAICFLSRQQYANPKARPQEIQSPSGSNIKSAENALAFAGVFVGQHREQHDGRKRQHHTAKNCDRKNRQIGHWKTSFNFDRFVVPCCDPAVLDFDQSEFTIYYIFGFSRLSIVQQ